MISSTRYWFLLALIVLVYLAGLFVTLFENDSAQFAVMAMRMVQESDFFTLIKGTEEYLDKPHMHYWLAAFSYKLFGIHDWAYRIPGVLAIFLGGYSCYGLGKLLYNEDVGKFSALIFLTAQTIVLSGIDVRTDAVLTGFFRFRHLAVGPVCGKGQIAEYPPWRIWRRDGLFHQRTDCFGCYWGFIDLPFVLYQKMATLPQLETFVGNSCFWTDDCSHVICLLPTV